MTTDTSSPTVEVPQGTIRYRDSGSGEPLVLIHGALVDSSLWGELIPRLEPEFRCIAPDLPLGSHRTPMRPDADLSPPGLARLISDFIGELGLGPVTLIGNDTGGALCQLVATRHPERLQRLVLTNCDAYENFLPLAFKYMQVAAAVPGALAALTQTMRLNFMRRSPIAYGWLTKRRIEDELLDRWTEPVLGDAAIRRDGRKLLRGISKRYTLEAAERLRAFDRPTLLAWGTEDRFFKLEYAERLARDIPGSRLERIEDARTFVSLDQPAELARLIGDFARAPSAAPTAARGG